MNQSNLKNEFIIPHNFIAREYQIPLLREVQRAIEGRSNKRYFYQVWHRRSGKDKTNIADIVPRMLVTSPCLVKYVYPTLVMGRENLWDGMGSDGFKYMDHIPDQIRFKNPNETTMKVRVKPIFDPRFQKGEDLESIFQIGGSDHPDSLRGGNTKLYIFSEWSEQNPYSWDVVEPILKENDGIAIFNMTPKGDNHARAMHDYAKNNPKWYVQTLTAEDTGVFTKKQLEEIQRDLISRFSAMGRSESEAMIYYEQEYMCSFRSPVIGSYYGDSIARADKEKRICSVPYNASVPVNTAWDLGMDDSTTIWFYQNVGQEIHIIDYYENSGEGLGHYAGILSSKGYNYGEHVAPPDIEVRELGTGKSRLETAKNFGIRFRVAPKLGLQDGIDAVRSLFTRLWIDSVKCERGINALKNYKKDWDEKNKVFRNNPKHDWSSHGSDAMRYLAVGHKIQSIIRPQTDFGGVKPFLEGTLA